MIRRWLLGLVVLVVAVATILPSGAALAAPFSRGEYNGYFSNVNDTQGGFVIRAGVHSTSVSTFISYMVARLNGTNAQDQTGAEFIILNMLGYAPGTSKATAHNAAVLQDWKDRVTYYGAQGWINFHASYSYVFNTYWQGKNGGGSDPDDDAWFSDSGSTGADGAIVFHETGTSAYYALRKECANPLGNIDALKKPPADFQVTLTGDRNGAASGNVVIGGTYGVRAILSTSGAADTLPGNLEIMYPTTAPVSVVAPCTPTCAPAGMTALTGGHSSGNGYRATSPFAGPPAGNNWYWVTKAMVPGTSTSGVISFTVAPTAAVGTVINFHMYYYQGDDDPAVAPKQFTVSFTVVSQRFPSLSGINGDIHAGGGIGAACTGTGTVTGHAKSASYGEYVVSASAVVTSINDFGATNSPQITSATNAAKLKLGKAGNYLSICRPDLVTAAALYRMGTGYNTWGGATFSVTGKSGVYFLDAPVTTISGTVTDKLTLVGKTIAIPGDITITTSNSPDSHDLPSMGIIASGDINLGIAATRVDAYLFANGVIDTCIEGATATNACNGPLLQINGFLMASNILFHRTGILQTNGNVVTERVVLNPQIYLNPPRLFDASVDDLLLEGQGERQPLF